MAPLFDSQLHELMTNKIISSSNAQSKIPNQNLRNNPSVLLSQTAKEQQIYDPIFGRSPKQKTSIFDEIFPTHNYQIPTTSSTTSSDLNQEKRTLLASQRFLSYSSYFRDQYDQQDHEGQYEEVEIGTQIYRFKKIKKSEARRKRKYRALPPAPRRTPVTRQISETVSNYQTSMNNNQYSTLNDADQSMSIQDDRYETNNNVLQQQQRVINNNSFTNLSDNIRLVRGTHYEKYCLENSVIKEPQKYYNRVVSFPKKKEPLPKYLREIKSELKKKYKEVFSSEDKTSSSSQSSNQGESNQQNDESKRKQKQMKKQKKLQKQKLKDFCQIVGQTRIDEQYRWGNREQFQKYLKKKEYDEKIKKMNEERMKKLSLAQKINNKVQQNKQRYQRLSQQVQKQNQVDNSVEKNLYQINIDEDDDNQKNDWQKLKLNNNGEQSKKNGEKSNKNGDQKLKQQKKCIISHSTQSKRLEFDSNTIIQIQEDDSDEDCVILQQVEPKFTSSNKLITIKESSKNSNNKQNERVSKPLNININLDEIDQQSYVSQARTDKEIQEKIKNFNGKKNNPEIEIFANKVQQNRQDSQIQDSNYSAGL